MKLRWPTMPNLRRPSKAAIASVMDFLVAAFCAQIAVIYHEYWIGLANAALAGFNLSSGIYFIFANRQHANMEALMQEFEKMAALNEQLIKDKVEVVIKGFGFEIVKAKIKVEGSGGGIVKDRPSVH